MAIKDRTEGEETEAVEGWAVTRVSGDCFDELRAELDSEPEDLPALAAAAKRTRENPAFYRP